jgi:hypothetical protein
MTDTLFDVKQLEPQCQAAGCKRPATARRHVRAIDARLCDKCAAAFDREGDIAIAYDPKTAEIPY